MKKLISLILLTNFIQAEVYPIDNWAVGDAMSSVDISNDGKYISFMQKLSKESDPVLKVFLSDDLSEDPYILGGESLEIVNSSWISNESIVVTFRGKARDQIEGFNRGIYEYRVALFNMDTKEFKKLDDRGLGTTGASFSIGVAGILPNEDNYILISYREFRRNSSFKPTRYYKYNLKSGKKSLVLKGRENIFGVSFDTNGFPREAGGFDISSGEYIDYYRNPGDSKWKEIHRSSENSFERFSLASYPSEGSSEAFVLATNGEDKRSLWAYDIDKKIFLEKIYGDKEADLSGVFYHYDSFNYPDQMIGVRTSKSKPKRIYFTSELASSAKLTQEQIEKVIPNSYTTYISALSKDLNSMVIYNTGPKDPGSYYLLKNGKISFIGSKRPSFKAKDLADVKYLKYTSRDGRTIPAYVTIPKGKGPFPLIVNPHGGPFVSETTTWDTWSQLLANHGYMVIQPQYRGSTGYGIDHYTSAFVDGGEGGYKMQDDKDDGVIYLIENGLVDEDRVAMFGWSYGGYAALVAASREDQLYQCVVSGAPVAKNSMQLNYYRNQLRGTGKLSQEKYWTESISPINEVEKVNVPILLIHGAQDQRVPVSHALEYVDKLEEYNKDHKYIQLEGADHFSNTLFYRHKKLFFTEMIDYLKNDCGPDGL